MRDNDDPDQPPRHLWQADDEDDNEDPLVTLGHMVKLASIGIWRKVSFKDKKPRPDMQERSNSDSRPVSYADDEDTNTVPVGEPTEDDDSDEKPSMPQPEVTAKTVHDEVVVVQTQAVSTVPIPSKEQ